MRLVAIHTPVPDWEWTTGKPDIDVEHVDRDIINTIEDQLLRYDIGIVPGKGKADGSEILRA